MNCATNKRCMHMLCLENGFMNVFEKSHSNPWRDNMNESFNVPTCLHDTCNLRLMSATPFESIPRPTHREHTTIHPTR